MTTLIPPPNLTGGYSPATTWVDACSQGHYDQSSYDCQFPRVCCDRRTSASSESTYNSEVDCVTGLCRSPEPSLSGASSISTNSSENLEPRSMKDGWWSSDILHVELPLWTGDHKCATQLLEPIPTDSLLDFVVSDSVIRTAYIRARRRQPHGTLELPMVVGMGPAATKLVLVCLGRALRWPSGIADQVLDGSLRVVTLHFAQSTSSNHFSRRASLFCASPIGHLEPACGGRTIPPLVRQNKAIRRPDVNPHYHFHPSSCRRALSRSPSPRSRRKHRNLVPNAIGHAEHHNLRANKNESKMKFPEEPRSANQRQPRTLNNNTLGKSVGENESRVRRCRSPTPRPVNGQVESMMPAHPALTNVDDYADIIDSIQCAISEHQGPRKAMEDRHAYHMSLRMIELEMIERWDPDHPVLQSTKQVPVCSIFAVMDGHQGSEAAGYVAENLVPNFHKRILRQANPALKYDIEQALLETLTVLEDGLLDMSRQSGWRSGCTSVIATFHENAIVISNIGDSRAVLSTRGTAIPLTADQNLKEDNVSEIDRVKVLGGTVSADGYLNGLLGVSRAFGNYDVETREKMAGLSADPEFTKHELSPEDEFLILACDGLWDVFTAKEATDFVRWSLKEYNDVDQACHDLVQEAIGRHTTDNVTVMIIALCKRPGFQWVDPPRPADNTNNPTRSRPMFMNSRPRFTNSSVQKLQAALK